MRAFARDLKIPASTLSEVLNGKKGISPKRSIEIAKLLNLPEWQKNYFCDLVTVEHAKSSLAKEDAKFRLKEKSQQNHLKTMNQSAQRSLTSWVDLAILELTNLPDFQSKSKWIAKTLDVDEKIVKTAVDRLFQTNLLEKDSDGSWKDASPLFSSSDGVPSESIRRFHKSVLNLAIEKIENEPIDKRTAKSVVFSISEDRVQKAQKILDEAVAKIVALADENQKTRETVYCFSSQLFPLIKKG